MRVDYFVLFRNYLPLKIIWQSVCILSSKNKIFMTRFHINYTIYQSILLTFFSLSFFNLTYSQFDNKSKPKIYAAPIVPAKPVIAKNPNEQIKFDFKKSPGKNTLFPHPNEPQQASVDLVVKNKFKNPHESLLKQLNTPEDNGEPSFKTDNFLGNFRSNGKAVRIVCRDYGEIDGDKVRVYLNDAIIATEIYLHASYTEVEIKLVNGFNKIEFQALNQGSSGPNTAEFIMFNDQGGVISSNKWNLTTGAKAKIIVTKEE